MNEELKPIKFEETEHNNNNNNNNYNNYENKETLNTNYKPQNNEIIKELPNWNIEPPIEIKRGE